MGLVIGISICVGGVVAFKKTRKRRKKKKQKKLEKLQEAEQTEYSPDELEDSGCDSGEEEVYMPTTVADIHEEVISDRGYSESVRKRKRAWPANGESDSGKSRTNRPSSGMTKLHEEWDENEYRYTSNTANTNSRNQRDSSGSPKSHKTHKNYKHLELNDSLSEDESESSGVGVSLNEKSSFGNSANIEPEWESGGTKNEVIHQIAKDMRMSIRVGESGNTVFKIYKTDNSQKKASTELRSTTEEVPV